MSVKPSHKAAAHAGTAFMRAFFERVAAGGSRTVIADDLGDLVTQFALQDFTQPAIRRAIRSLHHGGAIDCGHPNRDEFRDPPIDSRGYKITLLIQ